MTGQRHNAYYSAIDGLRAIAVSLVLLFHAGFTAFSGGFIGVDVFFVISGFLITGLVVSDIEAGKFSFARFYSRRALRLLPALFTVLICTLIAGYFILSPADIARLGRSTLYAAISASNIFFWLESGYFDQSAETKPLLHTWSLGVEEQFYFVWPLMLFLLFATVRIKAMRWWLLGLGVVSLIATLIVNNSHSSAAFFLMPFRAYQFAIGGVLALAARPAISQGRALTGGLAAIALVALSLIANGETGTLWINAILPAFAAGLFIWSSEAPLIKRVFGSAPFLWIGKRSYAIYLTHWPIMVLWPMATDGKLSTLEGGIAILLSLLTGALLHTLVEKRFRVNSQASDKRIGRGVAGTLLACLAVTVGAAHLWAGNSNSVSAASAEDGLQYDLDAMRKGRIRMMGRYNVCNIAKDMPIKNVNKNVCTDKHPKKPTVLVLGDSFGTETRAMLAAAYPDIHFAQLTVPGCRISVQDRITNADWKWCRKFVELGLKTAQNGNYDGLVLSSNWRKNQMQDLNELVAWANSFDMNPVVMVNRVRFTERVRDFTAGAANVDVATEMANERLDAEYRSEQETFAKNLKGNFTLINVYKLQCNKAPCPIFTDDGQLMYLDALHLTVPGINYLSMQLAINYHDLFDLKQ